MSVHIKFFSSLRTKAGCEGIDLNARTVGEAAKQITRQFHDKPDFIKLFGGSNAILNGENVTFLNGTGTRLKDDDELVFFPPLGGG